MEINKFVERGDLLFTKKVARGPENGALTITLKTPLAVLLLGGTNGVEWNELMLAQALASLGLFYSDDILDCLGDAQHKKLTKFLEAKYSDKKKS